MTIPRVIVLTVYPLLFIASLIAAIQTRRLARVLPSNAWTEKRRNMFFFCAVQVFGLTQNVWFQRQSSWLGAIYFSCTLIFVVRLGWFDYLLLQTNKKLRARVSRMPEPSELSGELPPEYWVGTFTRVVRDNIKNDYLKPPAEL